MAVNVLATVSSSASSATAAESAVPSATGDLPYPAIARITIGDPGHPGSRACTGTLIAPQWVLSAASCFADNPNDLSTVPAGLSKNQITATIAGRDFGAFALVPRTDRDVVMVRLVDPVNDVTPVAVATTAPATGEDFQVLGFGRTRTEWVPAQPHSATFTSGTVTASGFALAVKTPADATVCKGDAGGPALRAKNGGYELAAVTSRAWQGGCLGSSETRTGAIDVRVDDLASWIQQTQASDWKVPVVNTNSGKCLEIDNSQLTDGARAQQWTCHDMPGQRWTLHWAGNGWAVQNANSGKCLEIENSQLTDGARAQQWTCYDIPTQRWDLVKGGTGYALKNRNSGKCLEIENSQLTDEARAQQWTCYDIPTQRWTFWN
ncbi:RICIN domain-containing protein [Kitasatospora sp. NPDC001660]